MLTRKPRRSPASFIEPLEGRTLLAGPTAPTTTWIASPNFNSRGTTTIDSIVIHTTEGSYQSAVNTFLSTASQVSAHYIVDTNGSITQMVDNANRAWHATYYNSRSIGIENVGFAGQASTWNSQNLPALEKLVAYLAYTYNVPVTHPTGDANSYPNMQLNVPGIVAHGQVQPWNRTDPGPYFPWNQFITDVQKIIDDSTKPVQSPFGGTAPRVGASPVTIQAENFDLGGEGVAYHDLNTANLGGAFRTTDGVDIQTTTDTGGGYNLAFVKAGEWLEYTIDVQTADNYTFDFRVASPSTNGKFHTEIDGANITGALAVPNTAGWQTFKTVTKTGVALAAGQHVLRLALDANGSNGSVGNFNFLTIKPDSVVPPTNSITIQAEDFDAGSEGVAYHDLDKANNGGQYRATGVDIQTSTDTSGGYNLSYVKAGEWLNYTINLASAGTYTLDFRVASGGSNGKFHLEADGIDVTGQLTVPNSAGWQNWRTVTKTGVNLSAGTHVLKLRMDTNGSTGSVGNFNWLKLTPT